MSSVSPYLCRASRASAINCDLGVGGAVVIERPEQERGAFAVECAGGLLKHRPQGAKPHGAPVVLSSHQPGHVHALLQGEEVGGRGAGEKGREEDFTGIG
jgi:hypothetical protein